MYFGENTKVPEQLRDTVPKAPVLLLQTSNSLTPLNRESNEFTFNCDNCSKADLKEWLRKFDDFPVIKFQSLYGNIVGNFTSEAAFQCGDYQQWEVKVDL